MSLILHCGSDVISRDDLHNLPVPAPLGKRHVTRPFAEDVELVAEYLQRNGFEITSEGYGVKTSKADGTPQQFFGLLEIRERALNGEYKIGRAHV